MATKRIGEATEVITLAEAKSHLRLADGDHPDDSYIGALITSAREWCEEYSERAISTQLLETALNEFTEQIQLKTPVQSITSITYSDIDGTIQTISPDDYVLDNYSEPALIFAKFSQGWPQTLGIHHAVKVRYVAGYDTETPCPKPIIFAMLLIIGHLYENRQQNVVGLNIAELPMGVHSLLNPYRLNLGV